MAERIEQDMRTLKLGGMAKEWRSVQFENTEQLYFILFNRQQAREFSRAC